jgi:hypothetical protein
MLFTLVAIQTLMTVASAHGVLKTPLPRTVRLFYSKTLLTILTFTSLVQHKPRYAALPSRPR